MSRAPLPIDEHLPRIVAALRGAPAVVLVAPPGAGKTTRVPPALVEAGLAPAGLVLLQPRRIAARAAARRIAAEGGWRLGAQVGYQVRFDRRLTAATRIKVVTEGVLLRWLQDDPLLEGTDAVLLDEFHLRSVEADLALGLLREVREARPELRLVVMSATIDAGPVARYLDGCPVIEVGGRCHPLTIDYEARPGSHEARRGSPDDRPLARRVASSVRRALREQPGDVLVFLPGVGEIRRAAAAITAADPPLAPAAALAVVPLHGRLTAREQDRALARDPGSTRRRVVLATNVAETSLTVPGVGAVVDSGLVRRPRHDPALGLDRLEVCRVSLDSADQRAGRAGRTGPGRVYRLWTRGQHNRLAEVTPPEIQRVELSAVVLSLIAWGTAPDRFAWLDPPDGAMVRRALQLLERLGATGARGGITTIGRELMALPVHPRLGRLLLEAARHGRRGLWQGAGVAALLAEQDVVGRGRASAERPTARSDLLERLELLEALKRADFSAELAGRLGVKLGAARAVARAQEQLFRLASSALAPGRGGGADAGGEERGEEGEEGEEGMRRALLAGFSDRVARRRAPGSDRAVMVGGRGLRLDRGSVVREAELFVAVAVEGAGRPDALVTLASAVDRRWLKSREEDRLTFDEGEGRVVASRRLLHEDLCLAERPVTPEPEEAAELLAAHAAVDVEAALAPGREASRWLARVRFLRAQMPELDLPAFGAGELGDLLPSLCAGKRSLAELRREPLLPWLEARLSVGGRAALGRHAPSRLTVPSGAAIRLDYRGPDEPPVLAVQLQQLFGLDRTPRVAAGRVPVLLHLLSPAQRPVQMTQDLASFWEHGYPEVRKELRRRYPKHAWPEDPKRARPTRGPRRRPGKSNN